LALALALALTGTAALSPAHAAAPAESLIVRLQRATLLDLDQGSTHVVDELPSRHPLQPRGNRRFRLDAEFSLPDPAAAPLWALYFRQMSDGGEVRVNGVVVGEAPSNDAHTAVLNVRPFMFVVPSRLLHPGRNRLEVAVTTHDSGLYTSPIYIGPADVVREHYERHYFWQITMAQVGFDFALVNAAILIGIYALRRHEVRYLLMGLTALSWANVCFAYLLPPMPAALYPYWHLVRLAGIAGVAGFCWIVLWLETHPKRPLFGRLCLAWAAVGPLLYLLNYWLHDSTDSRLIESYWGLSLLVMALYPLSRLVQLLMRRWDWRRAVYVLAAGSGMLAGGADLLLSSTGQGLFGPTGYSAQATSPLWFTAMVAVLVKDFANFLVNQQRQNALMTRKLAEQQVSLQRLHEIDQQREREKAALQERQRIMQDIHDGLGSQLVSSLALSERGALDARQTSSLLRECIDDLRLAIDSLAGTDGSFAVMAGNLRFRMEPRLHAAGIALKWHSAALRDSATIPAVHTLTLLRILQESLGNALKHSHASEIAVTLGIDDAGLHITVVDNGRGFDPRQPRLGKGISGMEKRARDIGAQLAIDGTRGTVVRVDWPLAPHATAA
jgi:signal transduction histidine kinase